MEDRHIWYFKYYGSSVDDGIMDARKSSEALLWIDELMRYFLIKEEPSLQQYEFEIPVRIRKGSWEALIPNTFDWWVNAWLWSFLTAYLWSMAVKAWSDWFLETGAAKDIEKLAKWALISILWIIRIARHVWSMTKKQFDEVIFKEVDWEDFILIPGINGEYLEVPKQHLKAYVDCPEKILSKNAHIIDTNRGFRVWVYRDGNSVEEAEITDGEKTIFYSESEEEILFPDLEHGKYVELEGEVTRWNERTNTIWFQYRGHILTCKPSSGNIATYKEQIISREDGHFFPPVVIKGVIDRTDKKMRVQREKANGPHSRNIADRYRQYE